MNDNDVLERLAGSLDEVHLDRPVEAIMARGRDRQRRRRRRSGLAVGVAVLAVGAGLITGLGSGNDTVTLTAPADTPLTARPVHVRLASFSLDSEPGGSATLTLVKGRPVTPDVLRQDLADAGVPAVVEDGRFCQAPGVPSGLDQVVAPQRRPDGTVVLTFTPSAMPRGSVLSIGMFPQGTAFALVPAGAQLTCKTSPDHPFG
jgi:hypothetical protein